LAAQPDLFANGWELAGQAVQALARTWFTPSEKVPAGQSVQALAEVPEYVPAGQDWQAVSVSCLKNVPGGQHTIEPCAVQCLTLPALVQVPVQAVNTRGVPALYRATASASVIA
jgi:hypothetical protein